MTRTAIPPALAGDRDPRLESSLTNSLRIASITQRLASHVHQPQQPVSQVDAVDFFHLIIALSKGIDFAIANDEIPVKAQNLPSLIKKVCQRKGDLSIRAAIMVLMTSVKSACRVGWFSAEESKEIFDLANEIGNGFSGLGDTNILPSNMVSTVSTVMTRFYPQMKMGQILAYLDIKLGYGAFMVDFHIAKSMQWPSQETIRLFVAQTDNTETSACIISPQQANFLVNGRGVDKRNNWLMDTGPQLPSNLTALLKYGTNLIQVVGQFNGHYIVVVACMSMAASLETPVLQDYLQSATTIQDSDSDIIEGPSRISLNCPISYSRIRIPVKGHSCKHLQCFDFSNFVNINSRRPSWRCPHCNQHVCYTDIRVDQNMVKVLKEVGENVMDVIISADGSWRAVLESDENLDTHNNTSSRNKERSNQKESTDCMNSDPVVLDLTTNDEEMDAASTDEIQDMKPRLTNLQNQFVPTILSESNNTVGVNQNVDIQSENNFQAAGFESNGSAISGVLDAGNDGGVSEPMFTNQMASPVLTDAISPALARGAEGCGSTDLTAVMRGQYSAPGNLQLQQLQFVDSTVNNEYGRFSLLNRNNINRTPIAVQALPAPSQTPSPRQRVGINSLTPDGSPLSSQAASSAANDYRANSIEIERTLQQFQEVQQLRQLQLQRTRSPLNTFTRSDMASSPLQHHSAAQVAGLSASATHPDSNHVSTGLATENENLHQQRAVNLGMPQFRTQSPSSVQVPLPFSRSSIPQGGAQPGVGLPAGTRSGQPARVMHGAQRAAGTANQYTRQAPTVPVQVPTSRSGPSYPVRDGLRVPTGEQRVNIGGVQAVRPDNVVDLSSEQNWRPTGRMRGSLSGQAYSAALSQFMILPSKQTQPARTQTNPTAPRPSISPALQAYLGNRSAHVPQPQNNSNTVPANMNGGSGILPDNSLGTH